MEVPGDVAGTQDLGVTWTKYLGVTRTKYLGVTWTRDLGVTWTKYLGVTWTRTHPLERLRLLRASIAAAWPVWYGRRTFG